MAEQLSSLWACGECWGKAGISYRRKNIHKRMSLLNRCSNSLLGWRTHSRCPQIVFPAFPFTLYTSSFCIHLCVYALYIVDRKTENWSSNSLRWYVPLQRKLANPIFIVLQNAFLYSHIRYVLISQWELRNTVEGMSLIRHVVGTGK